MPSPEPVRSSTLHLTVSGSLASVVLVVAATRAAWPAGVVPPAGPLGLWRPASSGRAWFAALAAVAVCALALVFVLLYRRAAAGRMSARAVARTALPWYLPVLLAPPLLSLDAYSYAAQGWLLLSGFDPYTVGPAQLGSTSLVEAVSPVWRDTPAPYGPLSLALLRLVALAGGGDLPATTYLLRLVAVLAVAATAAATLRLAEPSRRTAAFALVVANPLVVLHLVGGVHLDAVLAALAALAVLAVRRRWWTVAALAAATAFAVKLPGVVLLGYVVLACARANGLRSRRTWRTAGVAVAGSAGYAALVPNGWGWLSALDVPGRIYHPYDPATVLGWLLHFASRAAGLPVGFPSALAASRAVAALAAAAVVATLIGRAAAAVAAGKAAALVGGALVAVALATPAVHAWYAAWGLAVVAAGAGAHSRWWMVALSVALCFTAVPDPLGRRPLGLVLTIVLFTVAVGAVFAAARPRRAGAAA